MDAIDMARRIDEFNVLVICLVADSSQPRILTAMVRTAGSQCAPRAVSAGIPAVSPQPGKSTLLRQRHANSDRCQSADEVLRIHGLQSDRGAAGPGWAPGVRGGALRDWIEASPG